METSMSFQACSIEVGFRVWDDSNFGFVVFVMVFFVFFCCALQSLILQRPVAAFSIPGLQGLRQVWLQGLRLEAGRLGRFGV